MGQQLVIIDDEVDLLLLMGDLLEMEGYSALALSDPARVSDIPSAEQVDLFLIDVMLPTISGVELAQELRRERFPRTPMVAMSASRLMCRLAAQSGLFQEVLEKPFDTAELFACIGRYLAGDGKNWVPEPSAG